MYSRTCLSCGEDLRILGILAIPKIVWTFSEHSAIPDNSTFPEDFDLLG
jgi:hypothetical protein